MHVNVFPRPTPLDISRCSHPRHIYHCTEYGVLPYVDDIPLSLIELFELFDWDFLSIPHFFLPSLIYEFTCLYGPFELQHTSFLY